MSATVPSVARSVSSRHAAGLPSRTPTAWTSLSATPLPDRSREAHPSVSSFGLTTSDAGRNTLSRLVVVGDDDAHALLGEEGYLVGRGDAAVHGDDELGLQRQQTLDGGRGQAVAFAEAVRHDRGDVSAQRAQPAGRDGCGGDAVEVEVAEHDDALTARIAAAISSAAAGMPGMRSGSSQSRSRSGERKRSTGSTR